MTFVLCKRISCVGPNLLQFTASNNTPIGSTRNQILLAALNWLNLRRASPPREKRVTWQESHCGESLTEVIVCMRVCTTCQYLRLTVRAAYSRAADRSMPSFCTYEEFVLLQLADFPSL